MQGGGGPAEPVLSKQSVLTDGVKATAKGGEPAEATEWHPRLNPCEKLTKEVLVPGDWTTKNPYCHSELVSESVPRYEQVSNIGQTLNQVQGDNGLLVRVGFTMAEILLSLTIIGVVAAITLPSLTGNINERTWNTQRKALYARFSQAIALMPALNGYGTLKEESSAGASDAVDTAAETFVTSGLAKVLKINNICDSEHLMDCGIPKKITTLKGDSIISLSDIDTLVGLNPMFNSEYPGVLKYSQINTKAAAFETANGESILTYYNPNCISEAYNQAAHPVQPKMCANFVYDLNGSKGPNTVGKDIGFMSVLYPADSVVAAPVPINKEVKEYSITHNEVGGYCRQFDEESRIPNRAELASFFFNKKLLGWDSAEGAEFWSSELSDSDYAWTQRYGSGLTNRLRRDIKVGVMCVKR